MSSSLSLSHASRAAVLGFNPINSVLGLDQPFRVKDVLIVPAGWNGNPSLVNVATAKLQPIGRDELIQWKLTFHDHEREMPLRFCGWLSGCMLYPAPVTLRMFLLGWRPEDSWPSWTAAAWEEAYLP